MDLRRQAYERRIGRRSGPRGYDRIREDPGHEVWAGVEWGAGHVYVAASDPKDLPATARELFAGQREETE